MFKEVVGLGLMRGLRCFDSTDLSALTDSAFNEGVLVLKSGRNTLRFLPPLTISKTEIDEGFKRLKNAYKTVN